MLTQRETVSTAGFQPHTTHELCTHAYPHPHVLAHIETRHTQACTHQHRHAHRDTAHTHTRTHMRTHTRAHTCTHTCTHTHMHTHAVTLLWWWTHCNVLYPLSCWVCTFLHWQSWSSIIWLANLLVMHSAVCTSGWGWVLCSMAMPTTRTLIICRSTAIKRFGCDGSARCPCIAHGPDQWRQWVVYSRRVCLETSRSVKGCFKEMYNTVKGVLRWF